MTITTNKAQIKSDYKGTAFMNICPADTAGVMVWGTLSKPTVLLIRDNVFELVQFEDEGSLNFWLNGIENATIHDVSKLNFSDKAKASLNTIKNVFPDCTGEQIIERALEMMAAYWRKEK